MRQNQRTVSRKSESEGGGRRPRNVRNVKSAGALARWEHKPPEPQSLKKKKKKKGNETDGKSDKVGHHHHRNELRAEHTGRIASSIYRRKYSPRSQDVAEVSFS